MTEKYTCICGVTGFLEDYPKHLEVCNGTGEQPEGKMEVMKPCPWCGKTDDLKIETTGPTFKVRCKDIKCGYEFVSLSREQAIWNWNNRQENK
jgi:hypothetical protein